MELSLRGGRKNDFDDFKKIIDGSIYPEDDYHKLLSREVKGEIFKYASYNTSTTISF